MGGARGEAGPFGEEDDHGLVGPTRDLLWPQWVGGSRSIQPTRSNYRPVESPEVYILTFLGIKLKVGSLQIY